MKKALLFVLFCAPAGSLVAQEAAAPAIDLRRDGLSSTRTTVATTPEMWFYEQERIRHDDPKASVRRKAEFRATQREHRLAALKWYGMSNSRPTTSTTPVMGTYSPTWVANSIDPFRWHTGISTNYVLRVDASEY